MRACGGCGRGELESGMVEGDELDRISATGYQDANRNPKGGVGPPLVFIGAFFGGQAIVADAAYFGS